LQEILTNPPSPQHLFISIPISNNTQSEHLQHTLEAIAMSRIQPILDMCYNYPERIIEPDEDREQFLQPWGFIIYRTFYGPGSDETWTKLLESITAGVEHSLSQMDGSDDTAATAKVLSLFKLDARSDPARLSDATLEDVRALYQEGGWPGAIQLVNMNNDPWRVFLLADVEVLGEKADFCRLKAVEGDYDPVDRVPKNKRAGPQRYFGWITMAATNVAELWRELDWYYLEEVNNGTEPGAFWDPDWHGGASLRTPATPTIQDPVAGVRKEENGERGTKRKRGYSGT
jgi:hypothetical protein